ncbi:glycosyltransferase family 2 protein [Neomoorella thermoacetica]|uniref:Glycosyl transferase, family 2 n=1 Tax=Moorella thermoacetica (strain ATCC 39073 / JCM 9320) TaxID=264732 RepID=Q2RGJ6_MOOTA|nr:glycosyltransferase [Moorella thermoacetica]
MTTNSVVLYTHLTQNPSPAPVKGKTFGVRPAPSTRRYISVAQKFWISQTGALVWVSLSVILSLPWLRDLSEVIGFVSAILVITFIAYVPGYLVAFLAVSLLVDRQPPFKVSDPDLPITILIAARNEASNIGMTLQYIANQNYRGPISVVLVDNGSTDGTADVALAKARELKLNLLCLREESPGKNFALNAGLAKIVTPYFITLDADTLLHRFAVKHIVARLLSSPPDVGAVAGHVLVRNSRDNFLTRIQEWDYFLGIASIKRTQGLYQGTLVAQGAFSLYKTEAVRQVSGWPDTIGEDIVLTWKLQQAGYRVYFEPTAVAFTAVPKVVRHFVRQRSRWARGMVEGMKNVPPWYQPSYLKKFLTGIDLVIPVIDLFYTLVWIPGLILACFGKYYIVGPYTLFVLPLNIGVSLIMYTYQLRVFGQLDLRVRKNRLGFFAYVLIYQLISSPVSLWGYVQELFQTRRVWR